jgi:hypothetical protein
VWVIVKPQEGVMAIEKGTLNELLSGRDPKEVFSKVGLSTS